MTNNEILLSRWESNKFRTKKAGNTSVSSCIFGRKKGIKLDYKNPIIPKGYLYVSGQWKNGFTIRDFKGNHWVWVPVGMLPEDGVFDGKSSKFGRRNFHANELGFVNDYFSVNEFHEENTAELQKQYESVMKYGGFYVSKYLISFDKKKGVKSVCKAMPLNNITFYEAVELAKKLGCEGSTESHLIYASEYDSICKWLIESEAKTYEEVVIESTSWGNYRNSENSKHEIIKTGAKKEYYANSIADLPGNLWTWTQEKYGENRFAIRGGSCFNKGNAQPVVFRYYNYPNSFHNAVGLRVALTFC